MVLIFQRCLHKHLKELLLADARLGSHMHMSKQRSAAIGHLPPWGLIHILDTASGDSLGAWSKLPDILDTANGEILAPLY